MEIRWTSAARRHRISRERATYVLHNAEKTVTVTAPQDSGDKTDERTIHLGRDSQGVLLEIITIPTHKGVVVIHAMPMRKRFQDLLD